jgi:Rrf2 family protein
MALNLTHGADYAVRVALHLAMLPDDARASRNELARLAEASPTFVAKILQQLVNAQIVRSRTGRSGGFELARSRAAISVLDIVTAIDGPLCLVHCLPPTADCHRSVWCPMFPVWAEAQAALESILGGTSLERLVAIYGRRAAQPTPPPTQLHVCGGTS